MSIQHQLTESSISRKTFDVTCMLPQIAAYSAERSHGASIWSIRWLLRAVWRPNTAIPWSNSLSHALGNKEARAKTAIIKSNQITRQDFPREIFQNFSNATKIARIAEQPTHRPLSSTRFTDIQTNICIQDDNLTDFSTRLQNSACVRYLLCMPISTAPLGPC